MKQYKIYWKNGTTSIIEGFGIQNAFDNAEFNLSDIRSIASYEEIHSKQEQDNMKITVESAKAYLKLFYRIDNPTEYQVAQFILFGEVKNAVRIVK